ALAPGPIQAVRLAGSAYVLSAPPRVIDDLPGSFITRRVRDVLVLPPEASGKTCYLAARFENAKGDQGPGRPYFSSSFFLWMSSKSLLISMKTSIRKGSK
ncbi:MAG: hypothetical protein LBS48_03530, partial [Treponema sp.]|nr:hypothetical protein [Treponema sp.]